MESTGLESNELESTEKDAAINELRKELIVTKHELNDLQQSRPHRIAVAFNEFRQNPIANFSKIGGMLRGFMKSPPLSPLETELDAIERGLIYPSPLSLRMNTLRYPNIKVACIGDVAHFINVAHSFVVGDSNWRELIRFRVDILVVETEAYRPEHHQAAVDQALDGGAKLVLIINTKSADNYKQLIDKASLVLDRRAESDREYDPDWPHFEPMQHNPAGLRTEKGRILSPTSEKGAEQISPDQLDDLSPNDIVHVPDGSVLSFDQHCQLLAAVASGAVVVSDEIDWALPAGDESLTELARRLDNHLATKQQASIRQRRAVILRYGNLARFERILDQLGYSVRKPLVSIILSTMRPDYLEQIADYISSQDQSFCQIEVIAVLHGDDFDERSARQTLDMHDFDLTIIQRPTDSVFGDNLNIGVAAASGDFITKMDDDDLYGPQHLNDLLAAYYYSNADIVGKWSHWVLFEKDQEAMIWVPQYQETFARHAPGGTLFTSRHFLEAVGGFGSVSRGIDSELYRRADVRGGRIYSTHPYNYIRVRHDDHTYDASNSDFKSRCIGPAVPADEIDTTFI